MAARLIISNGKFKGKEFRLGEGTNLIGRWDPDTGAFPEVDLDDEDEEAKISRKHAAIRKSGSEITIRDIGSLNGTFINRGDRLEEGKEYPLQEGDEVIVGKIFLRLALTE
ncbi:MAG: FHA domain-containing protein [Bdellovibrionales bacterium]|nr:FHA domain-containing protein [Bdellovibrionales bacterium]